MLAFPSVAPVRWGFVNWQSQPYGVRVVINYSFEYNEI